MAAASVPSGKVPGRAAQRVFCVRRSACICRLVALMAVVGLAEGFLTLPSRIPAGSASAQPGLCLVAERALPRVAARKAGGTSEVRRLRVSCSQNGGAGGADLVQQAIEKCRAAVEENPENEEAWFYLGVMSQESGKIPEALAAFQAAVKLNPTREAAFLNMGCILEAQGQTGAALQAFLGALKANAKSSDAYALLARLMDRGGKRDAARQACEQALALDGACEEAHVLRVEMLRRDGSADASRVAAQRGVDALPSSARLRTSLATVFLDLGRASEARRELERALELNPGDPSATAALGVALKAGGMAGQGEARYREAISLAPNAVEPRMNLALLYHERGPKYRAKAIVELEGALRLDPGHPRCSLLLDALSGTGSRTALPADYITELFDGVAHCYDEEVLPALRSAIPRLVLQALAEVAAPGGGPAGAGSSAAAAAGLFPSGAGGAPSGDAAPAPAASSGADGVRAATERLRGVEGVAGWRVADVGAGTGLSVEALRGVVGEMVGCDVAGEMVRAAKDKRLYSSVAQQGAAEFLSAEAPGSVNVVIAGDVAPWVGVLAPLFTAAKKALAPGGLMVMTTEEGSLPSLEGLQGPKLNEWVRFAHPPAYVESAAAAAGLSVEMSRREVIRYQGQTQVQGRVFVLRRE